MKCECLKLAVVKNRWLALRLGGDMYAVICKYEKPTAKLKYNDIKTTTADMDTTCSEECKQGSGDTCICDTIEEKRREGEESLDDQRKKIAVDRKSGDSASSSEMGSRKDNEDNDSVAT